ncbi:MAG: hypothetical protein AAF730_03190 [Bacteroidota bacterium]
MHRLVPAVYYSNAHIPLIAWMLLSATSAWTGTDMTPGLLILACAGAFIVYQIDHSWQVSQADRVNQPGRVDWIRQHQRYIWLSLGIAVLAAAAVAWRNAHLVSLSAGVLAGMGLAYSGLRGIKRRLRIPFVKPLLITAVWVYGTVVWPLAVSGAQHNPPQHSVVVLLVAVRLSWIGVNVWLAEGVDHPGDLLDGIAAIPTGMRGEKQLLQASSLFAILGMTSVIALGVTTEAWVQMAWELMGWAVLLGTVMYAYTQRRLDAPSHRWLRDVLVAWPGGITLWI